MSECLSVCLALYFKYLSKATKFGWSHKLAKLSRWELVLVITYHLFQKLDHCLQVDAFSLTIITRRIQLSLEFAFWASVSGFHENSNKFQRNHFVNWEIKWHNTTHHHTRPKHNLTFLASPNVVEIVFTSHGKKHFLIHVNRSKFHPLISYIIIDWKLSFFVGITRLIFLPLKSSESRN